MLNLTAQHIMPPFIKFIFVESCETMNRCSLISCDVHSAPLCLVISPMPFHLQVYVKNCTVNVPADPRCIRDCL